MKRLKRKYRIILNLLVMLFALVIFFGLAETMMRMANKDVYSDDYDGKMILSKIKVSSDKDIVYEPEDGWKDLKKYPKEKPENTFRILMLGDSVTEAPNIIRQSRKFKYIIRKNISDLSDKNIELLTVALPGYSTVQEVAVFRRYFREHELDLVIVNFISNDLYSYPFYKKENIDGTEKYVFFSKKYRQIPLLRKNPLYMLFVKKSVFFRFVNERAYNIYEKFAGEKEIKHLDLNKDSTARAIYNLKLMSREDNFELMFAYIPSMDIKKQVEQDKVNRGINDIEVRDWLKKVLNSMKITFFDMVPILMEYDNVETLVNYRVAHPSEEGHKIIAKEMLDFLIENKLVPIG